MAGIPVKITGTWTNADGASVGGFITGTLVRTDLQIGGGPILPPGPVDPGYSPPWAQVPGDGGELPPIVDPPPVDPGNPAAPMTVIKSAPPGGWGYYTDDSANIYAAYRPGPGGPQPKKR